MLKFSDTIQMSFKIPDHEKQIAQQASEAFLHVINTLSVCKDHISIIEDIFKKFQNISGDALHEKRGLLNRYKQQIKKNYGDEKFKSSAVKALHYLDYFSSDIHVAELCNAFKDGVKDLEKAITVLLDILDNYQDPEFRDQVLKSIENINKESVQLEQLVRDRVIEYLDDNILSRNWVNNTSEKLNLTLKNKKPLIMELFEERNNVLNTVPQINKRPQSLNPADNQRVWTPTDLRDMPENDDVGKYNK